MSYLGELTEMMLARQLFRLHRGVRSALVERKWRHAKVQLVGGFDERGSKV